MSGKESRYQLIPFVVDTHSKRDLWLPLDDRIVCPDDGANDLFKHGLAGGSEWIVWWLFEPGMGVFDYLWLPGCLTG